MPPAVHRLASVAGARGRRRAAPKAQESVAGPFLAPGSLTCAERMRVLDGLERVIEGAFVHLPLKRARYGFDPVQRLRILRTEAADMRDDRFHAELAAIVTGLRDAHTRYVGPPELEGKVAALPFLLEMAGSVDDPSYIVTRTGPGLAAPFGPGVIVESWNGIPIDRAVVLYSDREVGGRADSQRALATQSLTLRPLQYGPPPDESWVILGYRTPDEAGRPTDPLREIRLDWRIIDPNLVDPLKDRLVKGRAGVRMRRTRALDPAAAAMRKAKMLLFAPAALEGRSARGGAASALGREIPTRMTQVLKAMSIEAPDGPFGYLRIWGFDEDAEPFLRELERLVPLLPDRGLIIDVRGNPGGYICAAEQSLQLFTPKRIEPTRFAPLATPFVRALAGLDEAAEDLGPWLPSLGAAVRNGELYAQPLPISDPAACNAIGQRYGGPVLLVADATTYSSGDLFSAGFVDNAVGPFVCVGEATGAGGANVWDYEDLRALAKGTPEELPILPDGIGMTIAFRRATRSGPSEGLPIEDVGVAGQEYAMTRNDLLCDNRDLIAHCLDLLRKQPFTRLAVEVDRGTRAVRADTAGLDAVDVYVDGHAEGSRAIAADGRFSIPYRAGTREIRLVGLARDEVRQERRIRIG